MKKLLILVSVFSAFSSFACDNDICKGDRVSFGEYVGTAAEVFSNGKVQISVDGYSGYSFRQVRELGYELKCYN